MGVCRGRGLQSNGGGGVGITGVAINSCHAVDTDSPEVYKDCT